MAAATLLFKNAAAQSAPAASVSIPGNLDPGQLEQQYRPAIRLDTTPPKSMQPPEPQPLDQPANANSIRFTLEAVELEGNQLMTDEDLTPLFGHLLGTEVRLARVYQLADEITVEYRNRGYILTQALVPQQQIRDGRVTLRIIEGFIDQVRFTADPPRTRELSAFADAITASRPLEMNKLERSMLLMNDLPGLVASSTVVPSENTVGAADLLVNTSHDPLSGTLAIDNRGTRRVGPWQVDGSVNYNFLSTYHPRVGARVVATPGSTELLLASLYGDMAVGTRGDRLSANATWLKSEPELDSPFDDLESRSESLDLTYRYPVRRSRLTNVTLGAGVRAYNGRSKAGRAFLNGQGYIINKRDRTRQLKFDVTVDNVDAAEGITLLQVGVAHGLDTAGASDNDDTRLSTQDGRVDFTKFTAFFSRLQRLGYDWSLLAAINGQIAMTPLLSSEQFGLGGADFVRAYDGSEQTGDHGVAAKLELRYNTLPLGGGVFSTPYVFYDTGAVLRLEGNADDVNRSETLHAVGAGLRVSYRQLGGYLEVSSPRSGVVSAEGDDDVRVFAGLTYTY